MFEIISVTISKKSMPFLLTTQNAFVVMVTVLHLENRNFTIHIVGIGRQIVEYFGAALTIYFSIFVFMLALTNRNLVRDKDDMKLET